MEESFHFRPVFVRKQFFPCICLANPVAERFEPIWPTLFESSNPSLQLHPFGDEWVLQFAEFLQGEGAVSKGRVEAVDALCERLPLGLQTAHHFRRFRDSLTLPNLDLGEIAVLHLVRDHDEFHIPLHLCLKRAVTDKGAILAPHLPSFVRAAVVEEAETALLHMPFARNTVAARAASGEIHELKPLVGFAVVAGFGEGNASFLDAIKGFLGDHGEMSPWMEFAVHDEDAVVEGIGEHPVDRAECEGLSRVAHEPHLGHLLLDRGQRMFATRKEFENALHLLELLGMRNDGAELGLVCIADRRSVGKFAPTDFLPVSPQDDGGEVSHILIRHPKLHRDHEHIVSGEVGPLESADFLNHPALEHSDDLASILEVASQSVEFPC